MKGYVEAFKERMWKEIPGLEIADGAMVVPDTRMPAKKVQRPTATRYVQFSAFFIIISLSLWAPNQ